MVSCKMFPPSLPGDVKARSYRDTNGELGVLPADVALFLRACQQDGVVVLGWELWVVDHVWSTDAHGLVPGSGWCGLIPVQSGQLPAVFHGEGDADITTKDLAALNLEADVQPQWLPYIRVNFTLAAT